MQLVFDIPILANHGDKSVRRPHEASNIEAVVTGDRRVLVSSTNRFHGNHRLEVRPFRQLREGIQVRNGPYPPPYEATMRFVKSIKEILRLPRI